MHMLREYRANERQFEGGTPAERGRGVYQQRCEMCHGEATTAGIRSFDRATVISITALGDPRVRRTVRNGQAQMPAFPENVISGIALDSLMVFLANPASAPARPVREAAAQQPTDGFTRYTGRLGAMLRAKNGLVAINPPWAEIVAYDLNEGSIKWRTPLGTVPALAAQGITNTGNGLRIHRNGPIVTAGGVIFIGTYGDRTVRAFDKDSGKSLWSLQIGGNPEGLAATYQVGGRQYVAFYASGSAQPLETGNISYEQGKADAQGYYVFALPAKEKGR
jgi:quinoprotein glucose dehydrogenase